MSENVNIRAAEQQFIDTCMSQQWKILLLHRSSSTHIYHISTTTETILIAFYPRKIFLGDVSEFLTMRLYHPADVCAIIGKEIGDTQRFLANKKQIIIVTPHSQKIENPQSFWKRFRNRKC